MIRIVALTTLTVVLLLALMTGAAHATLEAPSAQGAFVVPVRGASISQGFGCTDVSIEPVDRNCAGGHWHSGIDLAVGAGTPVAACASGTARVLLSATGFGLHVVVDHGNGLQSLYGHLSAVSISDGAYVRAGERIGAVGSSGNSTGPHLHFEIDRDHIAQDPRTLVQLP
ncbi:MAG: M23 family metallopeptidase [Candidatus Dormibacteria bacterium]